MAPQVPNRRAAKKAAEKTSRKAKKQSARVANAQSSSSLKAPLVQVLLLSIGLALGALYGWYFRKREVVAIGHSSGLHPLAYDEDLSVPYVVVDLPGKGKGMIAVRDIQQGEVILSEKPLFMVPSTITSSPVEYLREKLRLVSEAEKLAFFNLTYVNFPEDKDPEQDLDHVALAIFETNAVAAGSSVGIFPRMARLNHGCASAFNSVYSYRETEETLYVHALKNIAKGEELLTTYTDTKKPRDQRRAYFQQLYGFWCTCAVCSLPDDESRASDARLAMMVDKGARFAQWMHKAIDGPEALELIRDVWSLGDEEGYSSERGRIAADAVWIAAAHSDADAMRQWGELAQKWYTYELGDGSEPVGFIKMVLAAPDRHPVWATREPLAVGGPAAA